MFLKKSGKSRLIIIVIITIVMIIIALTTIKSIIIENFLFAPIEPYREPTVLDSVSYVEEKMALWVKKQRELLGSDSEITDTQLYNYLARGKKGEYLTKEEAARVKCTKLDKNKVDEMALEYSNMVSPGFGDYNQEYDFDFPIQEVKTPLKTMIADFYVTSEGKVFIWPPYEENNELWIAKDTKLEGVSLDNPKNTYDDGHVMKVGNIKITTGKTDNGSNDVVLDINSIEIGDYINYNVSYVDVCGYDRYTSENGWRVLSVAETSEGTYDLEIISTGRPAMLYYDSSHVTNYKWAGTSGDRIAYKNEGFYTNELIDAPNMLMVSGLYYNFEDIIFNDKKTDGSYEEGTGYYININGQNQGALSGSVFRDPDYESLITGVRSVTLADFTRDKGSTGTYFEDVNGLFKIVNIGLNPKKYFLASPRKNSDYSVRIMDTYRLCI